jgi:hypothetical protein
VTAHTSNANNGYSPAQNQQTTVVNAINNITCGSSTNTISALHEAYQWIKAVGQPLALNTIVLFTDGSPNGVTANFQTRVLVGGVADSRFGWAINEPDGAGLLQDGGGVNKWPVPQAQSPASPNPPAPGTVPYSCNGQGDGATPDSNPLNIGVKDANSEWSNSICVNMPVICNNGADTIFGTINQGGDQNSYGAATSGPSAPTDTLNYSIPASCKATSININTGAQVTALPGDAMRQFIAYIPDTDYYGNNLHGVTATGTSPYGTVSGGLVTRDFWLFQANNECSPDVNVSPNCKNVGDLWANHTTIGMGSNFFPTTNAAYANADVYAGKFRPDQPNTLVAVSMNGAMSQAYTIRADTTYNIKINVIYLTGNATDAVDREFLPVIANAQWIVPLPYDSQYVANTTTPVHMYQNPAYQTSQESGTYLVTSDRNQLTSLFAQLASETLRLSQ